MPDENVAAPQPSPTPTPSQGINWKTILIGVVVGAVLLGGGGFLVYDAYQPKKEEPSTNVTPTNTVLKTYTNSELGFSLKYPSDVTVKDIFKSSTDSRYPDLESSYVSFFLKPEKDGRNNVDITCQATSSNIDQLLSEENTPFSAYPFKEIKWKTASVSGQRAITSDQKIRTARGKEFIDTHVIKKGKHCQIRLILPFEDSLEEGSIGIYNSMVSSFQIL